MSIWKIEQKVSEAEKRKKNVQLGEEEIIEKENLENIVKQIPHNDKSFYVEGNDDGEENTDTTPIKKDAPLISAKNLESEEDMVQLPKPEFKKTNEQNPSSTKKDNNKFKNKLNLNNIKLKKDEKEEVKSSSTQKSKEEQKKKENEANESDKKDDSSNKKTQSNETQEMNLTNKEKENDPEAASKEIDTSNSETSEINQRKSLFQIPRPNFKKDEMQETSSVTKSKTKNTLDKSKIKDLSMMGEAEDELAAIPMSVKEKSIGEMNYANAEQASKDVVNNIIDKMIDQFINLKFKRRYILIRKRN